MLVIPRVSNYDLSGRKIGAIWGGSGRFLKKAPQKLFGLLGSNPLELTLLFAPQKSTCCSIPLDRLSNPTEFENL